MSNPFGVAPVMINPILYAAREIVYPLAESAGNAEKFSASSALSARENINWSFPDNHFL